MLKKKTKQNLEVVEGLLKVFILIYIFFLHHTIDTSQQEYCPKLPSGRVSHRMRILALY